MSAFFIATVLVKDGAKFKEYAEKTGPTIKPFGGEMVIRGKFAGVLTGQSEHNATGIIRFPSLQALEDWYDSDAYQALIPLRDEASDITIVKYEEIA